MDRDAIDAIDEQLAGLMPAVDTAGLAVTGRILRLARHIEDAREAALRPLGLSVGDFDVLATIRRRAQGGPGVNAKDVQESSMITSGGMSKRLDRLQRDGLIDRRPDPQDRRAVLVTLTAAGRRLVDRALPAVLDEEARTIRAAVGAERDRERLAALLRRLLVALDR